MHVASSRVYFAVFVALLVLTLAQVGAASVDLGSLNLVAALAIAGAQALLVVLYFMHVRWSERLTALFIAGAFLWLVILIGLAVFDYMSRGWLGSAGG